MSHSTPYNNLSLGEQLVFDANVADPAGHEGGESSGGGHGYAPRSIHALQTNLVSNRPI